MGKRGPKRREGRRSPCGRLTDKPAFETRLKPATLVSVALPEWADPASETWRPVHTYGGIYEVSCFGRVRRVAPGLSTYVGRLLHPRICRQYHQVILRKNGIAKFHRVHVLVARAFLGEPPKGMAVNHKDAVKLHNWVGNLEYLTPRQNVQHALASGVRRSLRGENNPNTHLKEVDVQHLRQAKRDDPSVTYVELGRQYGITPQSARAIVLGISWSHV